MAGTAYQYRVETIDGERHDILFETDPISIPKMPLTLFKNHPNPFNPSTSIKYYLPDKCRLEIHIYDCAGRCIANLINKEQEMGYNKMSWDGLDERGIPVASGIYFYSLKAGKTSLSKKMALLR